MSYFSEHDYVEIIKRLLQANKLLLRNRHHEARLIMDGTKKYWKDHKKK